jgi:DNA mismatch repair protein MutS2
VPRLRAEAEVVDLLGDGSVRVAAGSLKLTVASSELRAAAPSEAVPARAAVRPVGSHEERREEPPIPTRDGTCDLRGLRVDDALSMATTFLDRALNESRRVVFLLHGHGTGALREAIRKELARSPYVERFRGADPDQGGEGVTVVWLA